MIPLISSLVMAPTPVSILFCGNSHTELNDVPSMVKHLAESASADRRVVTSTIGASFLEQLGSAESVDQKLRSQHWDFVVLQGLKLSSSHKYQYDHSGAVTLAKKVKAAGSVPVFFAEWPRRDWDEAEWIVDQYRPTAEVVKAKIIPVSRAWPVALKADSRLNLWAPDGNHASPFGSYMGAAALYYGLFGGANEPTWSLPGQSATQCQKLRGHARQAILGSRPYKNKGK